MDASSCTLGLAREVVPHLTPANRARHAGLTVVDSLRWAAGLLPRLPGWRELPAVRKGAVYVVDASSYFSRPGPRLVDGVELLAHILHPDAFPREWPETAMRRLAV